MASVVRHLAGAVGAGAGQLVELAAQLAYATVEGVAFAFGRRGAAVLIGAELVVLSYHAGVRRTLGTALATLVGCVAGRALWVLAHTAQHAAAPGKPEALSSVWDWEPPRSDAYESGAWHVLRALVRTANSVRADNPEIDRLLGEGPLQTELAIRLYYLYALHKQAPAWDQFNLPGPSDGEAAAGGSETAAAGAKAAAAAAGSEAAAEAGTAGLQEGQAPAGGPVDSTADSPGDSAGGSPEEEACDAFEPVPKELMAELEYYRPLACLLYDYKDNDPGLTEALEAAGYSLCFASHVADLSAGVPAYFLSISEGRQEVLLSVRGTFSPEDVFTDLLATGVAFAEKYHCHSGMSKAAMVLDARFGTLLAAAEAKGYQVTLTGHSLGAGVTSLLAALLKEKGLKRLKCYAFEPPACMDRSLADWVSDVVLSSVIGDDVVPRLSAELFAKLLDELASFDWKEAAEKQGLPPALSVVQHLSQLLAGKPAKEVASGSKEGAGGSGESGSSKLPESGQGAGAAAESALHGAAAEVREAAKAEDAQHAAAGRAEQQAAGKPAGAAEEEGEGEGAAEEGEQGTLTRRSTAEFTQSVYNPYVPGRVVFVYRLEPEPAGDTAGSAGSGTKADGGANGSGGAAATCTPADDSKGKGDSSGSQPGAAGEAAAAEAPAEQHPATGRVLLRPWHAALRSIRITPYMVCDHFIDSPFGIAALSVRGTA